MSGLKTCLALMLSVAVAAVLTGCGGSGTTDAPSTSQGESSAAAENSESEAQTDESSQDPEIQEALAKLSEEDRALAEKQKTCPVSQKALGSMGAPIKVAVQDQDVFVCCAGCEDPLKEDPDKYLADK